MSEKKDLTELDAAQLEALRQELERKAESLHATPRWNADPDDVQRSVVKLVLALVEFLRYGPPYYRMHLSPGRYDWSWTDLVLPEMQRLQIIPIMDLCHFGVPDWIGDFQNPDFPRLFAEYAGAFARRFPWIQLYTPVNEMFITAVFSARYGWWNEQRHDDRSYVTAIRNKKQ